MMPKRASAPRRAKPARNTRTTRSGHWFLREAKAHFSELGRRVRSEGPQHVTVHGKDAGVEPVDGFDVTPLPALGK